MNKQKFIAGRLRHRIRIEQRTEGRDLSGGIDYTWTTFADRVPAAIEPARVLRSFGGAQEQENYDVLIRIRWMSGLRSTMRVIWDAAEDGSPTAEKTYEITGVRTNHEVRHEVFLQCIERQSDGWRKG